MYNIVVFCRIWENFMFETNKEINARYLQLESKIKSLMLYLNFDLTLLGSRYLKRILVLLCINPKCIHRISSTIMKTISDEEKTTVPSIDKNIRWSIKKAYEKGNIKNLTYFKKLNKTPTSMQLIYWLFDYFICEYIYWI